MKRITMTLAAGLSAALMASAVATAAKPDNPGNSNQAKAKNLAVKVCQAEKRADKQAFRATYGKRAMRTCVKGEKPEVQQEIRNSAQECRAERSEDRDAFREEYGSNRNGKNAFGKCVSSKVRGELREDVQTFRNSAQECRAEHAEDRDAFREEYGSNRNGKNAFGKCVSSKVQEAEEPTPEPETS